MDEVKDNTAVNRYDYASPTGGARPKWLER